MLPTNTLINGRYRILRTVGTGGMGSVYAAQDERLGRTVALKLLRADLATDTRSRERFLREAQIAAQLRHPHIVRTYDVGDAPEGPFLVQELLDGRTLDALLPLPATQAANVIDQVADALSYIHGLGYIHCDIKPHNIMLQDDPHAPGATRVVLLDFGIARVAGTDTTTLIATPHYLAPERALGAAPSIAADLYALGIVFYQTLTGSVPFDAPTLHAIIEQHRTAPLPPIDPAQREAVALEPLIRRLTAKQPDARYPTAEAFRADLAAIQRSAIHDQSTVVVAPALPNARQQAAPAPATPLTTTAHKQIGLRFLWLPLLLGVLLLGAFAVRGRETDARTPANIAPVDQRTLEPRSQTVNVPRVIGLPVEQAQQQIEAVGLDFVVGESVTHEQPADTVVNTTPAPDQPLAAGEQVIVQVSAGPPQVPPAPVAPLPPNVDDESDEGKDKDKDEGKDKEKGEGKGKDKEKGKDKDDD